MREAGQQARFRQVEVAGRLAEVGSGSGLHSVGQVAVVDLVEVQLQYLVLAKMASETKGQNGLPHLSPGAMRGSLLPREVQVADELLGDGASPGDDPAGPQILDESPAHRQDIEARVTVEASVLHRNGCLPQALGDLFERHVSVGALAGQHHLVKQAAVTVVDPGAIFKGKRLGHRWRWPEYEQEDQRYQRTVCYRHKGRG